MIDRAIKSFVQHRVGGVIVSNEKGEIIYTDPRIILSDQARMTCKKRKPSMDDERCWELSDQYMFGSEYLVAPVLEPGARQRSVYLPEGKWQDIRTMEVFVGGGTVTASAPIDSIPVFRKL